MLLVRMILVWLLVLCFAALSAGAWNPGGVRLGAKPSQGGGFTVEYLIRCTWDSAADQDYTDGQVIDTAGEGCEDGDWTAVDTDGLATTFGVVSNTLHMENNANAWDLGLKDTDEHPRTLGSIVMSDMMLEGAQRHHWGLAQAASIQVKLGVQGSNYSKLTLGTESDGATKGTWAQAVDTWHTYAVLTGGYDSNGVPYVDGDTKADFKYGMIVYRWDTTDSQWKIVLRKPSTVFNAVYLCTENYQDALFKIDNFRAPDPASHTEEDLMGGDPLLLSHSFSADSDTPDKGNDFSDEGGTWTIAGGSISNDPQLSSEMLQNGSFASWTADDPDNWTVGGESGSDPEVCEVATGEAHADCGTPGGGFANLYSSATTYNPYLEQNQGSAGDWYVVSANVDTLTDGSYYWPRNSAVELTDTGAVTVAGRAVANNFRFQVHADVPADVTVDDLSLKEMTLSTLFYAADSGDDDVYVTTRVTMPSGYSQAGVALCIDSRSNPTDYIAAYYDKAAAASNDVSMWQYVGGDAGTQLFNDSAETYVAGASIAVIKDGGTCHLFYDEKRLGEGDCSDAGLVNNTIHGLFSTASANTLDNLTVHALGNDDEYANLSDY